MSVPLGLLVAVVFTVHALDAREKGESPWGAVLGIFVGVVVIACTFGFVLRPVPGAMAADAIRERSRKILRWAAPLAALLILAAAVAQFFNAK
jgi:hypothetical protein